MMEGHADLLSVAREDAPEDDQVALPLGDAAEPLVTPAPADERQAEIEPARALVLADFQPPRTGPLHTAMRWAYRIGIPGQVLSSPLRKPARPRLLGTVETPLAGNRSAGVALRTGQLMAGGMKLPVAKLDFASPSKLTPPFVRAVHAFTWMRDLAASAPRPQCVSTASEIFSAWTKANPQVGKGPAWTVELAGLRLLNWIVFAPILLSGDGERLKPQYLAALETTARWLDRNVSGPEDRLAQATGWAAITAAGLLMPDGWARRLYGEAGLLKTLGEMVGEDGGVLSRSPTAQADAVALLVDVRACYAAAGRQHPAALDTMLALLVPALLSLRMGDRGLGSWQGAAAMSEDALDALVSASGVRSRPMVEAGHWGYQRIRTRDSVLVFDAAPPPKPKHARHACASTLAFEFSHGSQRIIVNCGGAELAGALVPARIEQGLRGTSAHSTLVLEDANSTAILLNGQIGKGVEEVDFTRDALAQGSKSATRLEAAHNGYAARFGLIHRRILMLSDDGRELRGEDVLEPSGRKGKRGKIGFAMRFHLGNGVEAKVTDDGRGVHLVMPDASYWQFRLGGDTGEAACSIEDSLWVDGQGRPHATRQIVVEGLTPRSGGRFPWLLKRMG